MSTIAAGIKNVYTTAVGEAKTLLGNPIATAAGGAVVGATLTGATIAIASKAKKARRKSRSKKSRRTTRRSTRRNRKTRKRTKYARTARKRKDTSTKRIRMTKNGQPYIILKSGKARFISKRSAKASRRRKGGRY